MEHAPLYIILLSIFLMLVMACRWLRRISVQIALLDVGRKSPPTWEDETMRITDSPKNGGAEWKT